MTSGILQAERSQLVTLRHPLAALDADSDDMAQLDRAILQLDELFLLVVVGEFNAGKSAFINALLGQRLLPEGVTPTTTQVTILSYGEEITPGEAVEIGDMALLSHPIEWLHDINIVDTPGTNAIIRRHQEITEEFVPRADLILFVTSADRPFSESERLFLHRIREWGKKIVFVVNKIDILETAADVDRIVAFVDTNGRELLGRKPVIFPISARLAQRAKETFDADERTRAWAGSRFERLEDYILHTLDERERLRLKLANPLGVAYLLTERYLGMARARQEILKDDVTTIRTVEAQLAAYERDMRRDFKYHLSHVDNVLYAMAERGNRFFDETIRLSRILDLINADRIQGMFEREVVADTAAQIEAHTLELIDWMVAQEFKEWQEVTEYLSRRAAATCRSDDRAGERHPRLRVQPSGAARIGRAGGARGGGHLRPKARKRVPWPSRCRSPSPRPPSSRSAPSGWARCSSSCSPSRSPMSPGCWRPERWRPWGSTSSRPSAAAPRKDLQEKIAALRARLTQALTEQFEAELGRSMTRIREAIQPYTRFIETQQTTLDESQQRSTRCAGGDGRAEGADRGDVTWPSAFAR